MKIKPKQKNPAKIEMRLGRKRVERERQEARERKRLEKHGIIVNLMHTGA